MTQNTPQKYLYHITNIDISQFNWERLNSGVSSIADKELYTFNDLDIAKKYFIAYGGMDEELEYCSLDDSAFIKFDELCADINKKLPENVSITPDFLKKMPVGRKITLKDIESACPLTYLLECKKLGYPSDIIKQILKTRKKQITELTQIFKDKTIRLGINVQGIQFEGYPKTETAVWIEQQAKKYNVSPCVIDDFLIHIQYKNQPYLLGAEVIDFLKDTQYKKSPFTKEDIRQIYESYHQNEKIEQKEIDVLCSLFEGKNFKPVNFVKPESRRILKVALKPEAKIVPLDFPLRFSGIETVPDKAIYTLLNLPLNTSGEEFVEKVLKYNKYHFDMMKPVARKVYNGLNPEDCFVEASHIKRDGTISEMIECYEKEGPLAYKTKYGYSHDKESKECLLKKFDELKVLKQTYDDFLQKLGSDAARNLGIIDDETLKQKALDVAKMIVLHLPVKALNDIFVPKRLRHALIEMGISGSRALSPFNYDEEKGDVYHIWDLNVVHIEAYMNASTNMQWQVVARPPKKALDKKQEKSGVDLLRQMGAIGGSWR